MKRRPFTVHPLTSEEVSAVSGGLGLGTSPDDGFWRHPLPGPVVPMPPKAVVPVTPIEVARGPDNFQ